MVVRNTAVWYCLMKLSAFSFVSVQPAGRKLLLTPFSGENDIPGVCTSVFYCVRASVIGLREPKCSSY